MNAPSLRTVRAMNAPNVVILPTAPSRQVQQNYNRGAAAERKRLRDAHPWPVDRYVDPGMREARFRAKMLQEVQTTPTFFVLLAILDTVPREQRTAMIEKLAPAAVGGGNPRLAIEIIRSTLLNFGQQWDLLRAQQQLKEDGGA